jgi:RimK family alpha-L-glutamate ligase
MQFAILADPDSWYLRDLARAAAAQKHEVTQVSFGQIAAEVSSEGTSRIYSGEHDLTTFNAVLVRTMPPGSLEQVVFRMDCLARLEAQGICVINPAKAVEVAVDKYLTSAKLQAAGLLTPRTITCQTPDDAMAAFENLGGDVVVKPLFGSEGRGITRLNDPALALRAFKMLAQLGAVLYVQEFIEHEGCDLRLLVIGDEIFAMQRRNPLDWRTNVSRGAKTERLTLTSELVDLAHRAADSVGAPLAGVDVLPGKDGRQYVLEVNAVPGWKALARTLEVDVAAQVLQYVAQVTVAARR